MGRKLAGTSPLNKSKTAWQYRIKITLPSGEKIDTTCKRNEKGLPFQTAEEAYAAREEHKARLLKGDSDILPKKRKMTLKDVYEHYLESGEAKSKASATLAKQNSLWKMHIQDKFGNWYIDDITLADLQNYLNELYVVENYAYTYVEGFLRFFYLLFGYAYRLEKINYEKYLKMFIDKGTRLTMPKMNQADYEESEGPIETYNDYQIYQIEEIFKSEEGNLLTAFYLGLCCGLRISEAFAVRWKNIDWQRGTILINRQMHYEESILKLTAVKTLKSVRTVFMPKLLQNHLYEIYHQQRKQKQTLGRAYRDTERVYDEVAKQEILEGDFVNRKKNGEILTVNSMKYWAKKIKAELGIDFKFHILRHTFASNCANNNMNLQMLMELMGHKKLSTTQRYYLNTENKSLIERTFDLLNTIYAEREVITEEGSIYTTPADPRLKERMINKIKRTPTKV